MSQNSHLDSNAYNAMSAHAVVDTKNEQQPIVSSTQQSVYQANAVYSTNPYNPYYSMYPYNQYRYPYLAYQSPHVVPMVPPPLDTVSASPVSHSNTTTSVSNHRLDHNTNQQFKSPNTSRLDTVSASPVSHSNTTSSVSNHPLDHNTNQPLKSPKHKPSENGQSLAKILQSSDVIHWPLSDHLLELKRKHNHDHAHQFYNQIIRTKIGIEGLYKIGRFMWLQKVDNPTEHHKVKAHSFVQFMEWIPKQHKELVDAWTCYASSSLTSEQEVAHILSESQARKNALRALALNVFQKRLLAFMNVIKTLYMRTSSNTHHKDKRKQTSRAICMRCGKPNHTANDCRSKKHVDGTKLNGRLLSPRPKKQRNAKKDTPCKFGIKCHNSECKFKHTHKIRCPHGKACRYGGKCKQAFYCTRCKRTNHVIDDCTATTDINQKPLIPCMICRCNDHNHTHCPRNKTYENDSSRQRSSRKRMGGPYTEERPLKKRKTNDIQRSHSTGVNGTIIKNEHHYRMAQREDTKAERVVMRCAYCNVDLTHKDLWRCSQCKHKFYCGKQCQSLHWQVHKLECGKPAASTTAKHDIKMERVPVQDWSCYSIIYWFNRARDGQFRDIKYMELRKHFVIGKVKGGCDLMSINAVMLRMMGIHDRDEQDMVLNAIFDVVTNDDFDNVFANTLNADVIPKGLMDPVLYELMEDPVRVKRVGYIYERSFITKYIAANKMDPLTKELVDMNDIVECKELQKEIATWRNKNLIAA